MINVSSCNLAPVELLCRKLPEKLNPRQLFLGFSVAHILPAVSHWPSSVGRRVDQIQPI